MLNPPFFDIQVNGAFGVDFNDEHLNLDQLRRAALALRQTDVDQFLPTIITDQIDAMCNKIRNLASLVQGDSELGRLIPGIHVEGPFLSPEPGFRGTHSQDSIRFGDVDAAKRLIEAGNGLVKLVTLAPEVDHGLHVTRYCSDVGVRVFAGHTNASRDCLKHAIDAGLVGFTHLGNGCPLELNRHDNILNRILSLRETLHVSLIADGVHIPLWLLETWIRYLGIERVIITSDAMSAAGMPPGEYMIGGQPILVDSQRRTRHRDHHYLAGSASTMLEMFPHLTGMGLSHQECEWLMRDNARKLMGFEPYSSF